MSNIGALGRGDDYVLGVVEGFYGVPWNLSEREELFQQLKIQNMNTYFYAPKHDDKHRHNWREKYNEAEIAEFK
jgi:hypothetical protein